MVIRGCWHVIYHPQATKEWLYFDIRYILMPPGWRLSIYTTIPILIDIAKQAQVVWEIIWSAAPDLLELAIEDDVQNNMY